MKKYFVIGNPIDHSLSPKLHNYWIKKHKIEAIYDKKKLNKDELNNVINEIKDKKISGLNVTVPFKKDVIPYLDKLSEEAKKTQSVNTIYLNSGNIVGHNTDVTGFENAIKNINYDFSGKTVFIIGAGGVVPSILLALSRMDISKIFITNRTIEKITPFKNLFENMEILNWGHVPDFDIVINATSLGLNKNDEIQINFQNSGNKKLFYDVIYNPPETNFLKKGKKLGNLTENGKLMFIYQALEAFNLWHGTKIEINEETIELLKND